MNKKWKEQKKRDPKNSPILFGDEENGTSSPDEVKISKSTTPRLMQTKIHSTPIKSVTDACDSPEMDYSESPIEPLTQHPPREVGWDYQRPVTKEDDGNSPNSMDITKTPKRGVLLTKKRNSNSPLLYKPMKKQLIQDEQENMVGFVNELRAIKMKAKEMKDKKGEKSETPPKTENDLESQLVVEMDSQLSDDSDMKLQVSINSDELLRQGIMTNKNYNALLDDSIEDMMVMCSQEVEAKEFGDKYEPATQPINHLIGNKSNEKVPLKSSQNLSLEKIFVNLAKENVQPSNNTEKIVSDGSSKNSSASKADSNSLEIPDDSFDDFFVAIDDKDFCKNVNAEIHINSTNKFTSRSNTKPISKNTDSTVISKTVRTETITQSKTSTYSEQSKSIGLATYNCVSDLPASNASVQTKIVNTTANFGYLNKDYAMRNNNNSDLFLQSKSISNTMAFTSDTRLLKSKSYSDSNFIPRSSVFNHTKSTSNLGISTNQQTGQSMSSGYQHLKTNCYSTGPTGTESKGVRRIHSSSSLNSGRLLSTPAEIERKRQEAIMKREAKMKSQLSNTALKRPTPTSIKR